MQYDSLFGKGNGKAIYRSVSPGFSLSPGSVGLLFTIIALQTISSANGRVSYDLTPATYGGLVDDARSGTLNRVTAPGSEEAARCPKG